MEHLCYVISDVGELEPIKSSEPGANVSAQLVQNSGLAQRPAASIRAVLKPCVA
ncbi:hypothetical protein K443DRAFT_686963 [Laccaria amethystina LaAM-08-1]|uniref:Uncharacterized protein n=1 Tax=Laccaria amethystina LaAM-08-1 TaxID=1095629 RepID=A0A0C9WXJ4_9AGAR|nr:hypothetical protein K443DRAFT_686963 [Laccaria amethystina LaAM-08-1]